MQHELRSTSAYFITLTYDTDHLSFAAKSRRPTLVKRHLQLFFKRVRKAHEKGKNDRSNSDIKYFAVGEYGSKNKRPHYHVILFNADIQRLVSANEAAALRFTQFDGAFPVQLKHWNHGHGTFGQVSGASVGYTLKYMSKPKQKVQTVLPEFRVMSKGLGADYLAPSIASWHHSDLKERMYCTTRDGKKLAMPRYYKDKIYDEYQRQIVGHHQRLELLARQEKALMEDANYWHNLTQKMNHAYQVMYAKSLINRNL